MLINLRPSSYFMGSNVNLGSLEVTEATVSRSVSRSSYPARAAGQGLILHQFLSSSFFFFLLTLPAQRGRVLYCISFFLLLLLSSICQHANISDTLGLIMLILGQSNKSVNAHFWHDQFGIKGHDGVTGVKKVIFTKIAISSTDHMVWSCDSCILIS